MWAGQVRWVKWNGGCVWTDELNEWAGWTGCTNGWTGQMGRMVGGFKWIGKWFRLISGIGRH